MPAEYSQRTTFHEIAPQIALSTPVRPGRLQRFSRSKPAIFSIMIVILFVLMMPFIDTIVPFTDRYQSELLNAKPGAPDPKFQRIHWMGTDDLGRDIFTRLLYGTRISLIVGLTAVLMIGAIGLGIGLLAGYIGGFIDNLLMRLTDIMYAFPSLLFTMFIVATFGRSVLTVLLALGVANWVTMARLIRGQVLQFKEMDYVLSARSIGARHTDIVIYHILPGIVGQIIVFSTLAIPSVMTAEAALAFIGVGIDPSIPTLGRLINLGFGNIFSHPSQILFPVITLTVLTLAFTIIGDSIRDALDPRLA